MLDQLLALNKQVNRTLDNLEVALGTRKKITVRDDTHDYLVAVSRDDYRPETLELVIIDLTEETIIPF